MKLTKEQKFLYTRIAILAASAGWVAFAFAGWSGFRFWYGGFVLCFFIAFGLLNLRHHSPMWLALKRPAFFLSFYLTLAAFTFLLDRFGLRLFLWVYPSYHGFGFLWVYFVLYPFGGLAVLELLYFVAGLLEEPLVFAAPRNTPSHTYVDRGESVFFLLTTLLIVLGATGQKVSVPLVAFFAFVWMLAALIKLKLHIRHSGHYLLALILSVLFATMLHEFPNTIAREWVYLPVSALTQTMNHSFFGVPFWIWFGYLFLTLVPLRLWIFLVLNPRVK